MMLHPRYFLVLLTLLPLPLYGQNDAMANPARKERQQIKEKIRHELRTQIVAGIDREKIAERLGLDTPVPKITQTASQIDLEVEERVHQHVEKYFTEELSRKYGAEAAEEFPLKQVNDEVEIVTKRGGVVKGVLLKNYKTYIDVSGRRINKIDITGDSLATFDKQVNTKLRQRHVRRQLQAERNRLTEISKEMRKKLAEELYTSSNYLRRSGKWIPATEFLDQAVTFYRKKLAKKLLPGIKTEVYTEFGYTLHEGSWVKPADIPAITDPAAGIGKPPVLIGIGPGPAVMPPSDPRPPPGSHRPTDVIPPWERPDEQQQPTTPDNPDKPDKPRLPWEKSGSTGRPENNAWAAATAGGNTGG